VHGDGAWPWSAGDFSDHSYIGDTPTRSLAPKLSPKQPSFLLSPKQPSFLQKGGDNPTTESSNAGTCVQLDISFFKLLHLNIGLHLNIQKDGTKDGDNGRVTVEGSFAMAMTLGLPGTFVGSFVGQGYMRVSGNPPSMKSDGTRAFAGSSTIAQAKWLVTEWLALMVKDTKLYKFYAKFADKRQKKNEQR